jgi:hypothetical protein
MGICVCAFVDFLMVVETAPSDSRNRVGP